MIKSNGNKKNAHLRALAKSRILPKILGAMSLFNIGMSDLATIANVNYGSLRNGLYNPANMSLKRLEKIYSALASHIDNNYSGCSKYKAFNITYKELTENDE